MRHQQIRKQLFPFSLHDLFITAGILACAVGICFLLRMADTSEGFASPVFVLAVLLISRFTTGYLFGVVASILSVISINYIFTYPYWAFNFTLSGYPLTFLTLLGASLLTCTMTTKIKEQERLRAEGEKEKVRASLPAFRYHMISARRSPRSLAQPRLSWKPPVFPRRKNAPFWRMRGRKRNG